MTLEQMIRAFAMLDASGIRRPDSMQSTDYKRAEALMMASAKVYTMALSDLSAEDLEAATMAVIRSSTPFWPTPGQLLEMVPRRRMEAIDDSPAAWSAVLRYFRAGSFRDPNPGELDPKNPERDAAMRAALNEIGGARAFGKSQESQEEWWGKRFGEAYKAHRKRGHVVAEVLQIGGPQAAGRLTGSGFRRITGES